MGGVILEGVVGSGKSTLYRRLLTELPVASLALPEQYTERAHEGRDRGLPESLALLETILRPIESLHALHAQSKFATQSEYAFHTLLERFHLSHAVMFAAGDLTPYREIDARLAALGFRLLVLTVSEDRLGDRLQQTRATRNEAWNWYLDHKVAKREAHHSDADVQARLIAHYADEQRQILELARQSLLPVEVVATD